MLYSLAALFLGAIILAPSALGAVAFGKLWTFRPGACLRFVVLAPTAMIAKIATWVLALPAAALSVLFGWQNLPAALYWMQTHDDTLDGGQHQLGWPVVSGWRLWWQRAHWLWRNPAYGMCHYVLGARDTDFVTLPGPSWMSASGLQRRYSDYAVSVRGKFGPLYVWLGWKMVRADPDGRCMMALGVTRWKKFQVG